jgi:hypothetical protein
LAEAGRKVVALALPGRIFQPNGRFGEVCCTSVLDSAFIPHPYLTAANSGQMGILTKPRVALGDPLFLAYVAKFALMKTSEQANQILVQAKFV